MMITDSGEYQHSTWCRPATELHSTKNVYTIWFPLSEGKSKGILDKTVTDLYTNGFPRVY